MNKILISLFTMILICSAASNASAEERMAYEEIDTIHTALDDEYKAYTTYQAYLEHFGEVRPFSNIINSEVRHIEALSLLLEEAKLSIPENPYKVDDIVLPKSLKQACKIAAEAEIENDKLYRDHLIPAASSKQYVKQVFENLADASKYRHLEAFKRCAVNN